MVGPHRRSDRLDRPDRPKFPDQARPTAVHDFSRPLLDRTRPPHDHSRLLHDFNPTTIAFSTRSSRPLHDLYSTNSTSTQPIPDHFPMARPLLNQYPINRYRVDREVIGYWSNRGRADRVLIGIFFYPDQTRSAIWSFHDQLDLYSTSTWSFPDGLTSTQPISDHFPMASRAIGFSRSLLEFFGHVQKFRVGSRSDAEQGTCRPPLPSELDQSPIAWSGLIELIWSAVGTYYYSTLATVHDCRLSGVRKDKEDCPKI